jgi:hypothetical protein
MDGQNVKPWEVANTIWLWNMWKRDISSRFSVLSCTTFYELQFSVAKNSAMQPTAEFVHSNVEELSFLTNCRETIFPETCYSSKLLLLTTSTWTYELFRLLLYVNVRCELRQLRGFLILPSQAD